MIIQLKKSRDANPTLTCIRADGSRTWSRVHPFFPRHDMTHLAVEQVLGLRQAFFGLVALGWELDSFAQPGISKHLPPDAILAEHLVGLLDRERGAEAHWTAAEFNEALQAALPHPMTVTERQLTNIRRRRDAMFAAWAAVPAGSVMELQWQPASSDASRPTVSPRKRRTPTLK